MAAASLVSGREPSDQSARWRLSNETDRSFFVHAAAGSGKTTALISRIVEQLRGGMPPGRIVAITFTTAAASEMRDRLRSELGRLATGEVDEPWLVGAQRNFDELTIGTIHAYLLQLLTERSIQAGLPSQLGLLSDDDDAAERAAIAREIRQALYENPDVAPVVRRAFALGMRDRDIDSLVRDLYDHWHLLPLVPVLSGVELSPVDLSSVLDFARSLVETDRSGVPGTDPAMKLIVFLERWLLGFVDRNSAGQGDDVDDQAAVRGLEALCAVLGNSSCNPTSKEWGPQRKTDVKASVSDLRQAVGESSDALRADTDARLLEVIGAVFHACAGRRQRDGLLARHDLLVHATNLLISDPTVAHAVASSIGSLFVDEYQDTDPLQAKFVQALNGAGTAMLLFTVGDPLQSIYRFRGADVRAFDESRDKFGHEVIALDVNFRSAPQIVDFVNAVLPDLSAGSTELVFTPLKAHRADDQASVTHLEGFSSSESGARALEAQVIGDVILEMRAKGSVGHLSDIAILLPTRTGLEVLVDALSARGISMRNESREVLVETPEVASVITILGAIVQPNDSVLVVGALRTSLLGVSDVELTQFVRAGGKWDVTIDWSELNSCERTSRALSWLNRMSRLAATLDAALLVQTVLVELHAHEMVSGSPRPRDAWRRYDFLLDQARSYCDDDGSSLAGFLRLLSRQIDAGVSHNDRVVAESDDDAVRFMTIHGAKGLEFEAVIVAGFSRPPRGNSSKALIDQGGASPGVVTRLAGKTSASDAVVASIQRAEQVEELRLLYVALTRAKKHLIVSTHRRAVKSTDSKTIARSLSAAFADGAAGAFITAWKPATTEVQEVPTHPSGGVVVGGGFVTSRVPYVDLVEWNESRRHTIHRQSGPRSISATTLAALSDSIGAISGESQARGGAPDAGGGPGDRGAGGASGAKLGRAVHGVMQVVDFGNTTSLDGLAHNHASIEGIGGRSKEVANLVRHCLDAPVVVEASKSLDCHREVFVAAVIEGILVEGFIDLLYQNPVGDFVLVDYKTDAYSSSAHIADRMDKYRIQAATYALLLERSAGVQVSRCVLVFADAPQNEREVEVGDLESAKHRVLELLQSEFVTTTPSRQVAGGLPPRE